MRWKSVRMEESEGKIGFDRSRVRILLCDKDSVAAQEVKDLLCRCSYQVSVVKTARQVVDVLNIADSKVDLVLAEVELPNGKAFKMLKHVVKAESFKHIPIVMMSAHDEMAVVVKCLKLGAADYLVKPLRINELLNLWTHMWRRRRMLGLTEKHILKGHLSSRNIIAEIFVSDTSESNTLSTDMISDDSNDTRVKTKESKLRTIAEEQEQAEASSELELSLTPSSKDSKGADTQQTAERKLSPPRKSELKTGQTSAFLSYARVVSRMLNSEKPDLSTEPTELQLSGTKPATSQHVDGQEPADANETASRDRDNENVAEKKQQQQPWHNSSSASHEGTDQYQVLQQMCSQNDPRAHPPVFNSMGQAHIMPPLMLAHSIHPSTLLQPAMHYFQPVQPDAPLSVATHLSAPAAAFSYYPFPIHMPSQQVGPWTTALPQAGHERKASVAERREAALNKFRQKRKDRCYEKKIRYASRKRLAEQRPRVKGQFVRRVEDCEDDDEYDETTEMSPESGVEVTL